MYRLTLAEARTLAKEFIKRADVVLGNTPVDSSHGHPIKVYPSKDSGAMVRTSMELTRKLADLRNNR